MQFTIRTVSIETIDYCNRACAWCPNTVRGQSPDRVMPWELFRKIVNDVRSFCGDGVEIHPYFRNEPMCDPEIHDRVRYIRSKFPNSRIRLNSNGDFLETDESLQALFDAGVDSVHLMHYDSDKNGKFPDKVFGSKVTHWAGKTLFKTFDNKAGDLDLECIDKRDRCPFIGEKIMILHDGDVVTCCADFNRHNVFGNLERQSFKDIVTSKRFLDFRLEHERGRGKTLYPCNRCNRI